MNCHPERSEGPASCRESQASVLAANVASRQIDYIRRSLLVMIAVVALAAATQAQTKTAPVARKPAVSAPAPKEDDTLLYRNTTFGFRYQIPYGWVDRSKEMQDGNTPGKAELLLAVFEHPPKPPETPSTPQS